jgi:PAS domain S-box-containing protein
MIEASANIQSDRIQFSEELFRTIFEFSADALFLSTDDDIPIIVECNARALDLFDAVDKSQILGRTGSSFRRHPTPKKDFVHRSRVLDERGSIHQEVEYQTLRGRVFWGEYVMKRITVAGKRVRLTRIADISERKRIQDDLRRSEAMFAEAQRIAHVGSWEYDVQTGAISWSEETFRIYGLNPAAGTPSFEDFMHLVQDPERERLMTAVQEAINHGTSYMIESCTKHVNGEVRYHEGRGQVVRNDRGDIVKLVGTVRDVSDNKLSEFALRDNEERLRNIINNSNEVILTLSMNGTITFISDNWHKFLGYQPAYGIGKQFIEFVHPDDVPRLSESFAQGVRGELESGDIEYRVRHSDGSWRWHNASVSLVRTPSGTQVGSPSHIVAIARDSTDRRQIEERLRRSEESLAEAQRLAHLGNWYCELATNMLQCSDEMCRICTLPVGVPIHAKDFAEIVHPDDRQLMRQLLNYARDNNTQERFEMRIVRPNDGVIRWLDTRTKAITDDNGVVVALFGTLWDVSDRKFAEEQIRALNLTLEERVGERTRQLEQMNVDLLGEIRERMRTEQTLQARERLLQLVFDTVGVGLSLTDSNGVYRRVNQVYLRITGYEAHEIEFKSVAVVYPPDSVQAGLKMYRSLFEQNLREQSGELQLLRKDGTVVEIAFTTSLFKDSNGEDLAITTIADISLRKHAEDEIRRALEQERELNALKTRFVVMVSHEFRTPLTTIQASAELLERNRERWSPEKQGEYLRDIGQSVDTMTHLLEDILAFGKGEARRIEFNPQPTDILAFLESILNGFRVLPEYANRVNMQVVSRSLPHVSIDVKLLRQILTNLLTNALKYSADDMLVRCSVEYRYGAALPELVFCVKDVGIGMSEDDQKHLFEPFYRAGNVGSRSGTGLGLAIVKQAVDIHGGTIRCVSQVNVGTEFEIIIPCKIL